MRYRQLEGIVSLNWLHLVVLDLLELVVQNTHKLHHDGLHLRILVDSRVLLWVEVNASLEAIDFEGARNEATNLRLPHLTVEQHISSVVLFLSIEPVERQGAVFVEWQRQLVRTVRISVGLTLFVDFAPLSIKRVSGLRNGLASRSWLGVLDWLFLDLWLLLSNIVLHHSLNSLSLQFLGLELFFQGGRVDILSERIESLLGLRLNRLLPLLIDHLRLGVHLHIAVHVFKSPLLGRRLGLVVVHRRVELHVQLLLLVEGGGTVVQHHWAALDQFLSLGSIQLVHESSHHVFRGGLVGQLLSLL